MKSLAVFAVVAAMMLWSRPANATFYGSALPGMKEGAFAVGAALSDISRDFRSNTGIVSSDDYSRETLLGDYGLSEKSLLRLELGTADFGRFRGTEFALGYRREVGEPSKFGEKEFSLRKGVFVSFRTATLSAGVAEADFTQIDVGAGGQLEMNDILSIYMSGVFSRLEGSFSVILPSLPSLEVEFEGDSSIGLIGGFLADLDPTIQLGGELHFIFESGFALFGRFLF
ncbi:MAG: hypothetical protein IIA14_10715 [SAR324 cluster bacterium]|nr:hypothetical protein [SAR324 cluster bacterium]